MSIYINTNMGSLLAQQNLASSQSSLQTSLQRLSSGLRINTAADDPAGMAIANRMTSQINGMMQAGRNANDGISLVQTANGAMQTIADNLQTMRDLAVQASNATETSSDRQTINNQIQQLSADIQRIATSTNFNGTTLIDGSFNAQVFQVGANQGNTIAVSNISNMQTSALGSSGTTSIAAVNGTATTQALTAGMLTLNGTQVGASSAGLAPGQSSGSAYAIANAINAVTGTTNVSASVNGTTLNGTTATATAIAANQFTINGVNVGAIANGQNQAGQAANVAAAINAISGQTGVTATVTGSTATSNGSVVLTASDGRNISVGTAAGSALTAANVLTQTGLTATTTDYVSGTAAIAGAAALTMTVNGDAITTGANPATNTSAQNAAAFVTAFNSAALVSTNAGLTGLVASSDSSGDITLTNTGTQAAVNITATTGTGLAVSNNASQHGTVSLSSTAGNIILSGSTPGDAGFTTGTTVATVVASVNNIASLNVLTAASAQQAITTITGAINQVNTAMGALGAIQNRFTSAASNLTTFGNNLSAARSRIQDTDYAAETANLSRNQILQQAGTAMLAQANSLPNGVLALLR